MLRSDTPRQVGETCVDPPGAVRSDGPPPQRVAWCVAIPTSSDLARLCSFYASVDVTEVRSVPRFEKSVV